MSSPKPDPQLPVSKQTAGGVAGAVIGSAIAGPVGAVLGAVAGTMMGNRAAQGKPLVSSETVKTAKRAVQTVESKLPSRKGGSSAKAKAGSPPKKLESSKPPTPKVTNAKAAKSQRRSGGK